MDKISLARIEEAHPAVRQDLIDILQEAETRLTGAYSLRYTWVLRTDEQQNDLYAQGRTRPGEIVTWAKAGESWHNYGLAVDICLLHESGKMVSFDTQADFDGDGVADWMEVVGMFKRRGWDWGGDWPAKKRDRPHFQKTFGLTIEEAKKRKRFDRKYIEIN